MGHICLVGAEKQAQVERQGCLGTQQVGLYKLQCIPQESHRLITPGDSHAVPSAHTGAPQEVADRGLGAPRVLPAYMSPSSESSKRGASWALVPQREAADGSPPGWGFLSGRPKKQQPVTPQPGVTYQGTAHVQYS